MKEVVILTFLKYENRKCFLIFYFVISYLEHQLIPEKITIFEGFISAVAYAHREWNPLYKKCWMHGSKNYAGVKVEPQSLISQYTELNRNSTGPTNIAKKLGNINIFTQGGSGDWTIITYSGSQSMKSTLSYSLVWNFIYLY